MSKRARWVELSLVALACAPLGLAANPPKLQGVYEVISDRVTLPGGMKNTGSPAAVELLPNAASQARSVELKKDPWNMCQPVGPFRIMAKEQTKIEIAQVGAMVVILFEDLSHGMARTVYLKHGHPANLEPSWLGHSAGRWEGDTLVVDTVGFNDRTWLNDAGAQHSDALHLSERIRPVLHGEYLEYKMTADDPKVLAKPYSYTRYYKKTETEIMDDVCQDQQ